MKKSIIAIASALLLVSSLASAQTVGVRGTAKGTSTAIGVTSTAVDSNHTGLDVTVVGGVGSSGGEVVGTTLASAVTTNTTSTAVAGLRGTKTFYGAVTGTGAVTQTQVIYGGLTSGVTSTTGSPICTFTLSGTTHAHAECVSTAPWLFYIVVTTNTTGTGASGAVTVMY